MTGRTPHGRVFGTGTLTRPGLLAAAGAWTVGAYTSPAPSATSRIAATARSAAAAHPPAGMTPSASAQSTPTPTGTASATYPPASAYAGVRPTAWGMHLPKIDATVPAVPGRPTLALTFDACGGPGGSNVDTTLLDLLRRERIPATLFLNGRWIRANMRLTQTLVADPQFEVENHGTRHGPLSVTGRSAYGIPGTSSAAEVITEIDTNRALIADLTGRPPVWFRTGTAHYDNVAVRIAHDRGVRLAGFAVNGDAGATLAPRRVAKNLTAAPDGAIVLMHMNQPSGGTAAGLERALPALRAAQTRFVRL